MREGVQQHLLQAFGGDAERLIFPSEQADAARGERLFQRQRVDAGKFRHADEHVARDEPNAQVAADNREHLVDGCHLHIRTEGQAMAQEEVGVVAIGGCPLGKTDKRIVRELRKRYKFLCQLRKSGAADGNFLNRTDLFLEQGIGDGKVVGYKRKIDKTVLRGGEPLLGGGIHQADTHMGIFAAVTPKNLQQAAAQAKPAGCDADNAALQALVGENFILRRLDILEGEGDVRIQLFSLRRQAHALGRAEEQGTAQLGFQPSDDARDIRLVVVECGCGVGKALVLCGIVENTVTIIANIHKIASFKTGGYMNFVYIECLIHISIFELKSAIILLSSNDDKTFKRRGIVMDYAKESLRLHKEWKGKIEMVTRVPVKTKEDLSLAYTPGVAQPCLEIQKDLDKSYELTRRWNTAAVITDGSAVLGLGDIGPEAGMPVMEGKCVLFKAFGDVDALPLCVKTKDVDAFVETVYNISGSFGGINLEDISAPRCFEIERKLKERCDIPIFHDDQHGTAVITLAGLTNALKVVGKKKEDVRVVTSGAGAAAIAITKLLLSAGFTHITMCDRKGAIYKGREGLNWIKAEMAEVTNLERRAGSIADMLVGADVFIGVSAPNTVTTEMVKTMNKDAIIFACANPTPEIFPDAAKAGGARVISTGRSDYPNQINNVLAFPGIFRGAFDVRASDINEEMKVAAAEALAGLVGDQLSEDYIIPAAFDPRVGPAVAKAVAEAARRTGVARI